MIKTLKLISLFLGLSHVSVQAANLVCTHPQVCELLKKVLVLERNDKIINTFNQELDPHHFEVSPEEIKKILSANFVFRGPKALRPSLDPLFKKVQSKKVVLEITQTEKKIYPGGNNHSYAHFWLFPKIYCAKVSNLRASLMDLGLPVNKNQKCLTNQKVLIFESFIRAYLKNHNITIILSHDSFAPYLQSLGIKTIILLRSGHHHHVHLQSLKSIEKLRKSKTAQWFWLLDNNSSEASKFTQKSDPLVRVNFMRSLENIFKLMQEHLTARVQK